MPITFECACGKTLRVADANAGKRVKCPACNEISTVPQPEPEFEVVESPPPEPEKPKGRPVAKPSSSQTRDDDDDDDNRGYGVKKSSRDDDDDEEEERPKKKKKPKRRRSSSSSSERGSYGNSNTAMGEIVGGLISLLIGVILCAIVMTRGGISPLGIVLVICGIIGVIKGLAGGSGG